MISVSRDLKLGWRVAVENSLIEALRRRSDLWADYAKVAQAEVSTLSRWLNASLLAINGAASSEVARAAQQIDGLAECPQCCRVRKGSLARDLRIMRSR